MTMATMELKMTNPKKTMMKLNWQNKIKRTTKFVWKFQNLNEF